MWLPVMVQWWDCTRYKDSIGTPNSPAGKLSGQLWPGTGCATGVSSFRHFQGTQGALQSMFYGMESCLFDGGAVLVCGKVAWVYCSFLWRVPGSGQLCFVPSSEP